MNNEPPQHQEPQQTEEEKKAATVLNFLTRRDAKLAVEFLQSTRSPRQTGAGRDPVEEQQEKTMGLDLATHIAENDPQTALRIAGEYLIGGLKCRSKPSLSLREMRARHQRAAASPCSPSPASQSS